MKDICYPAASQHFPRFGRLCCLNKSRITLLGIAAALIFSVGLIDWGQTREPKEKGAPPAKYSETIVVAADKDYSPLYDGFKKFI